MSRSTRCPRRSGASRGPGRSGPPGRPGRPAPSANAPSARPAGAARRADILLALALRSPALSLDLEERRSQPEPRHEYQDEADNDEAEERVFLRRGSGENRLDGDISEEGHRGERRSEEHTSELQS